MTSQIPLFKMTIVGPLPWGSSGHHKSKNPVNNHDPTMRHVVGGKASQPEKQAASTSEVGRFETEILSTKNNLTALMNLSGRWIDTVHERKP